MSQLYSAATGTGGQFDVVGGLVEFVAEAADEFEGFFEARRDALIFGAEGLGADRHEAVGGQGTKFAFDGFNAVLNAAGTLVEGGGGLAHLLNAGVKFSSLHKLIPSIMKHVHHCISYANSIQLNRQGNTKLTTEKKQRELNRQDAKFAKINAEGFLQGDEFVAGSIWRGRNGDRRGVWLRESPHHMPISLILCR